MCGIFGIINRDRKILSPKALKQTSDILLRLSESRGKEATGVAVLNDNLIKIYKEPLGASRFIQKNSYHNLFSSNNYPKIILGHTRLATNGDAKNNRNNQPIIKDGIIGVHNGIIVNAEKIWKHFPSLSREQEIDTEALLSLISYFLKNKFSLIEATRKAFDIIQGTVSLICLFNKQNYLLAATNNGSLYYCQGDAQNICLLASEYSILQSTINKKFLRPLFKKQNIKHIESNFGLIINLDDLTINNFSLSNNTHPSLPATETNNQSVNFNIFDISHIYPPNNNSPENNVFANKKEAEKLINENFQNNSERINKIQRCSRCILPATIPFINFDEKGICNYCRHYEKIKLKNIKNLEKIIAPHRPNNQHNCLVMFSGGRDSSYGLHFIKNELKMNPIAYSYDWGMLTDLGRRNQARMCGQMGVEHILISANIDKKRNHIKKNIEAWLKKPDMGTIPLFMAGDKQFFYYANKLKKQLKTDLVFLCVNPLEKTGFKTGFCGIKPDNKTGHKFYRLSSLDEIKLIFYYFKQYLNNQFLMNSSLLDTFFAYASYYLIPHNYLNPYEFIKWDEKLINDTLINKYDWELADDTETTWRIGDGTAAFYNYIYYTVAGFTENDTLRSNQIRENMIDRKTALILSTKENKPRIESLEWYGKTIDINLKKTIQIINNIPKLY